tara:strand:- start:169 stop:813 length:645 start_codon:yes stop_codon:yes gene_type:complete
MVISDKDIRDLIRGLVVEAAQVDKLRVLDFDDTIAETSEQVKLYTQGGRNFRMLSSDEFAIYRPKEGEYYDESSFYQFDDVDVDTAQPVKLVTSILRKFVNSEGSRRVLILTARNQAAETGIRNFLKSIGIDDAAVDVVGVGDKDPAAKVKVIHYYLTKVLSGVRFVSFFDDSGPNVNAVKKYLTRMGIRHDVARVVDDEEGFKRLVRVMTKRQ